jgi:pimeloyl-ACP methyl ester carboxylesterase
MTACLAIVLLALGGWEPPATRCAQVAPTFIENKQFVRSKDRDRAVLLIHGLTINPLSKDGAKKADFREWQQAESALVKRLGKDADVFAFSYAQTTTADEIPEVADLGVWVERLRKLGYKEIVLIGHSAGGVIAREFVEDNPESGVTKVIQVCAPNEGSLWAKVKAVRANQVDFLKSMTTDMRRRVLSERADVRLPDNVDFVCIAGTLSFLGDVVVPCRSQWSEDLQKQGVPVYPVGVTHWHVMYSSKVIDKIAGLVREPQPRWDADKVAAARKQLIGK